MARKKKSTPLTRMNLPDDYGQFLDSLKQRVRRAQARAELIQLYWDMGREIVLRQEQDGWGKGVIDRLATDIQHAFPGIRGFSTVNIGRMRSFFLAYGQTSSNSSQAVTNSGGPNSSQLVTQSVDRPPKPFASIPWGHNQVLLFKLKDSAKRLWYASKTVEHGWSRTVQIESDLYGRQGKAISNFADTLPPP